MSTIESIQNREYASENALPGRSIRTTITANRNRAYLLIKRAFDLAASLFAMILLSPVMLLIALLIRVLDGRPVIYVSERVGTHLKKLRIYKFRTMVNGADQLIGTLDLSGDSVNGPRFKLRNDPRVTKLGGILRKLSLDELPQLWNVFTGDISIVGPRPHSVYEVKKYSDYALQRFIVKSGLVCYSECEGRSGLDFNASIESDLRYIREQSVRTDLRIICKTVIAIIKHTGAM